jgi:multiple sugar transport system substrate-binding protein
MSTLWASPLLCPYTANAYSCRGVNAMRNSKGLSIIVAAMTLMLAACGPALPAEPASSSSALSPDTAGELTVYTIDGPPLEAVKAMQTVFKKRYPNVDVKIKTENVRLTPSALNPQDAGRFALGLIARQKSNELEDVLFNADLFVPQLVDAGVVMDVEPLAKADAANVLDDIYPNVLAMGKLPDQPGVFMMPMGLETVQMYYNKTLFDKAGAPLPTATTTWDEFLAACKRITEYKPDTRCFDFDTGTWWPYFLPWIAGYGGSPLSSDGKTSTLSSPASKAGLAAYAGLWNKQDAASQVYERGRNCFAAQRCATMFQISAFIGAVRQFVGNRFEWDVQRVPAQPRGQFTGQTAMGFSINKNTKNPQLAWEFLKLLAHPDVQMDLFNRRQTIPMLKSLSTNPDVTYPTSNAPPANMGAFVNAGEMSIVPPVYPVECGGYYSGVVLEAMTKLITTITNDPTTIDAATKTADEEIQACLQK